MPAPRPVHARHRPRSRPPQPQRRPLLDVPPQIARSPLMGRGGFAVFDGLVGALMPELLAEAVTLSSNAVESRVAASDGAERGGAPARCYLNGPGGPVQ